MQQHTELRRLGSWPWGDDVGEHVPPLPSRRRVTRRANQAPVLDSSSMHTHEIAPEAPRVRLLRRSEYHDLVERGAFDRERVELLKGMIIRMSPQGDEHVYAVTRLNNLLAVALDQRALVQVQCPIAVGPTSEPEPDLTVIPLDALDQGIAERAHLIIEVANSSLATDRAEKLPLYAAAGFPDVWLVDVNGRAVFVHRAPTGDAWAEVFRVAVGGTLSLLAFPDVKVEVAALFRPARR